MSSKNKENKPRGSLGSDTWGPAYLLNGVTTTRLASFDHSTIKKYFVITSLWMYCDDLFLLMVAGADDPFLDCDWDPSLWLLSRAIHYVS